MKHKTLFRRTTALLMALVLSLSLTLPALAADSDTPDETQKQTQGETPGETQDENKDETQGKAQDQTQENSQDEDPYITLSEHSLVLTVGGKTKLTYTKSSNVNEATVNWSSSANGIVEVSGGELTAKSTGTAVKITITAKLNDGTTTVSDICSVTVKADTTKPTQIFFPEDQKTLSLTVNDSHTLNLKVTPDTADLSSVTWESSDPTVATVDANGKVTAKSSGTVEITARVTGTALSATCTVSVHNAPVVLDTIVLYLNQTKDMSSATVNVFANGQTVSWASDNDEIATVDRSGLVTAVSPGETKVTATNTASGNSAYCTVIVSGMALYHYETDERLTKEEDPLLIPLGETETLTYKTFGAAVESASAASASWYSSNNNVATVANGNVYARGTGKAIISVELGDYRVECNIEVTENDSTNISGTISADGTLAFSGTVSGGKTKDVTKTIRSQLNERSLEKTGDELNYITSVSVSPSQGTVYYNYASPENHGVGVGAMDTYYYSNTNSTVKHIDDLTFVPKSDYQGIATISYTGYSDDGQIFTGSIRLTVNPVTGISYTTPVGTPVTFLADDFSTYCESQTGRELSYVTFALPADSRGTLYYNYANGSKYAEQVTSGAAYYRSRNPKLSSVTLVPASGYSGSFDISYRGVDTAGTSYNGTVTINVTGGVTSGDVYYSGTRGKAIHFSTADFNTACKTATGEALSTVQFTLPDSGQGSLYLNYSDTSSSVTKVSAGKDYQASSISSVSFVAATSSDDIVILPFTATGASGSTYAGQVHITLDGASEDTDAISYVCEIGKSVYFSADDFNKLFLSVYGVNLNFIQFTAVPTNGQGKLYYKNTSTQVTTSTRYYRTGSSTNRLLSSVFFTADSSFQGTVKIPFIGQSTAKDEYEGSITIQVTDSVANSTTYYGTSMPVTLDLEKLQSVCHSKTGYNFSYISFTTLPSQSSGRLYADYTTLNTGKEVTIGTKYYDADASTTSARRLVFLPKAGFQGTATFSYTGGNVRGDTYTGTISVIISTSNMSTRFTDMTSYSSAIPSVEFLYQNGIVNGVTSTSFNPGKPISRAAFVTMLVRAFQFQNTGTDNFPDVPKDSYYAQAVATAKALGIVTGSNGKFMPNRQLTRQEALVMIYRAMQVKGNAPTASSSTLSAFTDGDQVSYYARDAVSAMVQLGVVQGYSSGQLGPHDSITRAAMAVILHRILTL